MTDKRTELQQGLIKALRERHEGLTASHLHAEFGVQETGFVGQTGGSNPANFHDTDPVEGTFDLNETFEVTALEKVLGAAVLAYARADAQTEMLHQQATFAYIKRTPSETKDRIIKLVQDKEGNISTYQEVFPEWKELMDQLMFRDAAPTTLAHALMWVAHELLDGKRPHEIGIEGGAAMNRAGEYSMQDLLRRAEAGEVPIADLVTMLQTPVVQPEGFSAQDSDEPTGQYL